VLKVLYSPQKTLKEVIQNPKYLGPLLIMTLLIAVNVVSTYAVISKEYYEQILPNGTKLDEWTEKSTLWTSSNQTLVTESSDAINGSIYGSASIAFTIQNSSQVWMKLTGVGPVDCTAPNGFDLLSFRIKWTSPATQPKNVTIQLFSYNSTSDYFYSNLTDTFSNSTYNIWNNITIPLGSSGWYGTGPTANWGNIAGLQLQFTWVSNSNVTLLMDGLFFRGPFKSLLESQGTNYLLNFGVLGAMQFVITWILLSGLLYILGKAFKGKIVWKPMLIAVGFILMTMFIGVLINAISYSTLPVLRFPFEAIGGVHGEGADAIKTISDQTFLVSQVSLIAQLLVWVWTAALASVAVHLVAEFSWAKSVAIAIIAYVTTIFLASIIAG
jgi:hypothetical protein